jgi:hypothetical protein
VWRKLGITDISANNLLGIMLRLSELEIRSDIIAQLVFGQLVLPPEVLTRVAIEHFRHQCRKTIVLSFQRCLINSGVEK